MNRKEYKLYTWYPLTDDEYWVDVEYQDEFPDCQTIVCDTYSMEGIRNDIMTYYNCPLGWGTMAKSGTWKFIIVEKPKNV